MAYQPRPSNHDEQSDSHNRRLYNPYQDLQVPIQNLYKLPTSPEFLFQEESVAQRRSWGENLTYLVGSVFGAGIGLVEGIKSSEPGDTMKLRVNRILNASDHYDVQSAHTISHRLVSIQSLLLPLYPNEKFTEQISFARLFPIRTNSRVSNSKTPELLRYIVRRRKR